MNYFQYKVTNKISWQNIMVGNKKIKQEVISDLLCKVHLKIPPDHYSIRHLTSWIVMEHSKPFFLTFRMLVEQIANCKIYFSDFSI